MSKITDELYCQKITAAMEVSGYQVEPAELSFKLGKVVGKEFGPNPCGLYASLGLNLPRDRRLKLSDANFHLGENDVVVLLGTTIEDARHFSYTLYQYCYEDEDLGCVITRSSIGDCFNNVNIKTADGSESRFDAPFVILIGSSHKSREAVASILVDCIDKELLNGKDFINQLALPPRMASTSDTLHFLNRISYIGQPFGETVPELKVKALEEKYLHSRPYRAFVARGAEEIQQEPQRRWKELNRMVKETAENLENLLAAGYSVTKARECQVKALPDAARFIGLDLGCDSPDALYRSIFLEGDLRSAAGKIISNRLKARVVKGRGVQTTMIKLAHLFNLGDEDFLLFVGVNYTLLKQVVYFSYALYNKKYTLSLATFSDTKLLETTEHEEIFAFAAVPNLKMKERVEALLNEQGQSSHSVCLEILEKHQPFFLGGRIYIDRITNEQPNRRDLVPGIALLFKKN